MENSDQPGISASVLWKARKAVMRGKIIFFSSHKTKKENSKVLELEIKIKSMQDAYGASPDEHIQNRMKKNGIKLNN